MKRNETAAGRHAFLWWTSDPSKLSPAALAACQDPDNQPLLSVASVWEMVIKEGLGKLRTGLGVRGMVTAETKAGHIALLPVTLDHLWALESLPWHHRDPFDRLLVAQCRQEKLTVVSADAVLRGYGVSVLW